MNLNSFMPVRLVTGAGCVRASANELNEENSAIVGHIFSVAAKIAKSEGIAEGGYRIVNNCGADGGQTVGHLHFHMLGGRSLQWPPG